MEVEGLHKGHKPGEGGLWGWKSSMITCCRYKVFSTPHDIALKVMMLSMFWHLFGRATVTRRGLCLRKRSQGALSQFSRAFCGIFTLLDFFPTSFIWKYSPEATRPTWQRNSTALHYCSCVQLMRLRSLAHRPWQAFQSSENVCFPSTYGCSGKKHSVHSSLCAHQELPDR